MRERFIPIPRTVWKLENRVAKEGTPAGEKFMGKAIRLGQGDQALSSIKFEQD